MSVMQQISSLVEQLPEKNQILVLELVKTMVSPYDVLSGEDEDDIMQARVDYEAGELTSHAAINWD